MYGLPLLELDSYKVIQYSVASKRIVPVFGLQHRQYNVHKFLKVKAAVYGIFVYQVIAFTFVQRLLDALSRHVYVFEVIFQIIQSPQRIWLAYLICAHR
jgi:hypothetical protein